MEYAGAQAGLAGEGEEAEGKEDIEPELVGEAPEGGVGAEGFGDCDLKEEEVLEEDGGGVAGADVDAHVIVCAELI